MANPCLPKAEVVPQSLNPIFHIHQLDKGLSI